MKNNNEKWYYVLIGLFIRDIVSDSAGCDSWKNFFNNKYC